MADTIGNHLILCEHPPVYTVGKHPSDDDWLVPESVIQKSGIEVVRVERGGRITYHGPGQLVVYFILNVMDVSDGIKAFVHDIEAVLISLLQRYGIDGQRDAEHPGVWVGRQKIAAIGLHITKGR